MIDRISGDTVDFWAVLRDNFGTLVATGTGTLSLVDANGSTVLTAYAATNAGTGIYTARAISSAGYGKGPISERWKWIDASGTYSSINNNNIRIVGTDTVQTYINADELALYYENIPDYFDGNEESQVVNAFWEVNARLKSLGQKLPFVPKPDGFYDQPLRDLNAYEALVRIISKRQSSYTRDNTNQPPWFMSFKTQADKIYKAIENKVYNFNRDTSVSEGGVGIATKTAGTSVGQVDTNWKGGVGEGFIDDTFDRTWIVQIIGTGTSGCVEECGFIWSNTNGIAFQGTGTSSLGWQELQDGVWIRFTQGTYSAGTTNIFAVNDKWQFNTSPKTQTSGGARTAKSY